MEDNKVFQPKPGQTNYTNARWAVGVSCVIKHNDKILIVKRSSGMKFSPGLWNGIGGFLDDQKSLEEKVKEELDEEAGIKESEIISIKPGNIFDLDDTSSGKTWIIYPALVEISTDRVILNWEAEEYKWISPEELKNFDVAAGFMKVAENFFNFPEN